MTAARKIAQKDLLPPIELFASIVGDGVTDDSTAIKAAHDAAFAAGVREVYCGQIYNAPSAYNLGNVIFRGPGTLSAGDHRKKIIPFSARASSPSSCVTLSPAVHLRRFAQDCSLQYQIIADSTGSVGANEISLSEDLWELLESAIWRDNVAFTPTGINRAVPGSTWPGFTAAGGAGVAPSNFPSWYTVQTNPWTTYTKNLGSKLVTVDLGTNAANTATIGVVNTAINSGILSGNYSIVPDILLFTNLPCSSQFTTGSGTMANQDAADRSAASTRAYARWQGYALIDRHRMACMERDGFDPCTQVFSLVQSGVTASLPWTGPFTDGDFDKKWQIDNTGGAVFGTGSPGTNTLDLTLGWDSNNLLRIAKGGGGQYTFTAFAASGLPSRGIISTAVSVPNGLCTIQVCAKQDWVTIYAENTLVFEGLICRASAWYQPKLAYTSSAGSTTSYTILALKTGTCVLTQPSLTDIEAYGTPDLLYPSGGNGNVHPASGMMNHVDKPLLDCANFSVAASGVKPTQQITAAAAVNAEAATVQITGPASSTYAITLAAPRVQDQGRMLSLVMIATTSTNSVTLALTNVTGGTAAATCTWNAAGQRLVLMASNDKWEVIKQDGVTVS